MKKNAFTLAEVLITLAIIGVVAALTVPTLIQNYQKRAMASALAKTITLLDTGFRKMFAEEGLQDITHGELYRGSNMNDTLHENDVLGKYFKSQYISEGGNYEIKPYEISYGPCGQTCGNKTCHEEEYSAEYVALYPHIAGTTQTVCFGYSEYNLTERNRLDISKPRVLANGAHFWIISTSASDPIRNSVGIIIVDVNGQNKPNQLGYDIQRLPLWRDGHVTPANIDSGEYAININGPINVGAKRIQEDGWKITY